MVRYVNDRLLRSQYNEGCRVCAALTNPIDRADDTIAFLRIVNEFHGRVYGFAAQPRATIVEITVDTKYAWLSWEYVEFDSELDHLQLVLTYG